jgi:hypothetical protein
MHANCDWLSFSAVPFSRKNSFNCGKKSIKSPRWDLGPFLVEITRCLDMKAECTVMSPLEWHCSHLSHCNMKPLLIVVGSNKRVWYLSSQIVWPVETKAAAFFSKEKLIHSNEWERCNESRFVALIIRVHKVDLSAQNGRDRDADTSCVWHHHFGEVTTSGRDFHSVTTAGSRHFHLTWRHRTEVGDCLLFSLVLLDQCRFRCLKLEICLKLARMAGCRQSNDWQLPSRPWITREKLARFSFRSVPSSWNCWSKWFVYIQNYFKKYGNALIVKIKFNRIKKNVNGFDEKMMKICVIKLEIGTGRNWLTRPDAPVTCVG